MVGIAAERLGNHLLEFRFDLVDRLARRKAGAVAYAKHMGVDGERLLAEGGVEHDIGRFPPDSGERLKLLAGARHLAAMIADQCAAEGDDVVGLGVE